MPAPLELTAPPPSRTTTFGAQVQAVFDRYLDPDAKTPIGVAFSGGGDSLAALLATKIWADRVGRPVIAFHVDHGLQAASGAWAEDARMTAQALGLTCLVLRWTGDKPAAGLAAAARQARHGLIAAAARAAGVQVVVFGHTADDAHEAELMRAEGSSLGWLAPWRPSPVWPAGRGVFLLRPLLDQRRAALREDLRRLDRRWIDDPANENLGSPRIRARRRIEREDVPPGPAQADDAGLANLARAVHADAYGGLTIDRAVFAAAPAKTARRLLSAALTCAGGGDRPPRRERREALMARLSGDGPVIATLAGAKLLAGQQILFVRETGAYRRFGTPKLVPGGPGEAIWDGRFQLTGASMAQLDLAPLMGRAEKLPKIQSARLSLIPSEIRPSLPVVISLDESPTCPILADDFFVTAKSLVADRFFAFCGVISKESEI